MQIRQDFQTISIGGGLGSKAYAEWDWGGAEGLFTAIGVAYASEEAKIKVKEAQDALAIMVIEDDASIASLLNIIASTNNPELIEAAEGMIKDIEERRDSKICEFLLDSMDGIEVVKEAGKEGVKVVAKNAVSHYVDGLAEKFIGKGLSTVGMIASGGKLLLNWDTSYESAKTLMTYSVMKAELNVIDTLSSCDTIAATNDMVQLWYSLQINGTEAAKQFAKDCSSGLALYLGDVGLADENSTVTSVSDLTAKLDAEAEEYKNEASEFADYCNNNAGN